MTVDKIHWGSSDSQEFIIRMSKSKLKKHLAKYLVVYDDKYKGFGNNFLGIICCVAGCTNSDYVGTSRSVNPSFEEVELNSSGINKVEPYLRKFGIKLRDSEEVYTN